MGSPRSEESKKAEEEKAKKESRVVYLCPQCGAIGQAVVLLGELHLAACVLCYNPVEPFIGYRREN